MLSARSRDPPAARESVDQLAVTAAEQIFSLAWNPVTATPTDPRIVRVSDCPLRTAAGLYLPKLVSSTPASRPPPVTSIGSLVPIADSFHHHLRRFTELN